MTTSKAYKYKRFMRDGTVKEQTGVTRSRAKKKKEKPNEPARMDTARASA